ncbi:hypothetical protein [Siccirubricoccus phaeus]|uniref:hypothetical protein n=1 Tax=Siccirubricoccus phaeus TaxID=2595053 RepID=UPI0011F3B9AE
MGGTPGSVTINSQLMQRPPYDVLRDLAPVAFVGDSPGVLVVNKASRFRASADHRRLGDDARRADLCLCRRRLLQPPGSGAGDVST